MICVQQNVNKSGSLILLPSNVLKTYSPRTVHVQCCCSCFQVSSPSTASNMTRPRPSNTGTRFLCIYDISVSMSWPDKGHTRPAAPGLYFIYARPFLLQTDICVMSRCYCVCTCAVSIFSNTHAQINLPSDIYFSVLYFIH